MKKTYNLLCKRYYKRIKEDIMADLLSVLQDKLSGKNVKIVLPEGEDERVLIAATQLQKLTMFHLSF